jgi:hypothetical protein
MTPEQLAAEQANAPVMVFDVEDIPSKFRKMMAAMRAGRIGCASCHGPVEYKTGTSYWCKNHVKKIKHMDSPSVMPCVFDLEEKEAELANQVIREANELMADVHIVAGKSHLRMLGLRYKLYGEIPSEESPLHRWLFEQVPLLLAEILRADSNPEQEYKCPDPLVHTMVMWKSREPTHHIIREILRFRPCENDPTVLIDWFRQMDIEAVRQQVGRENMKRQGQRLNEKLEALEERADKREADKEKKADRESDDDDDDDDAGDGDGAAGDDDLIHDDAGDDGGDEQSNHDGNPDDADAPAAGGDEEADDGNGGGDGGGLGDDVSPEDKSTFIFNRHLIFAALPVIHDSINRAVAGGYRGNITIESTKSLRRWLDNLDYDRQTYIPAGHKAFYELNGTIQRIPIIQKMVRTNLVPSRETGDMLAFGVDSKRKIVAKDQPMISALGYSLALTNEKDDPAFMKRRSVVKVVQQREPGERLLDPLARLVAAAAEAPFLTELSANLMRIRARIVAAVRADMTTAEETTLEQSAKRAVVRSVASAIDRVEDPATARVLAMILAQMFVLNVYERENLHMLRDYLFSSCYVKHGGNQRVNKPLMAEMLSIINSVAAGVQREGRAEGAALQSLVAEFEPILLDAVKNARPGEYNPFPAYIANKQNIYMNNTQRQQAAPVLAAKASETPGTEEAVVWQSSEEI